MTSPQNKPNHFLDISALDKANLRAILDDAAARKKARAGKPKGTVDEDAPLAGHVLAMVFEKPSTRTRVSFEVGMRQLGGDVVVLSGDEMQLGRGESVADTARVLSRYVDAIMIRTHAHDGILELADHATVPVINGLTDASHPCQIMADIQTFEEHCGPIEGQRVAWVGDGNNVAVSWVHAAARFGFELAVATPPELALPDPLVEWAKAHGTALQITNDPVAAVSDSRCVVTDTWVSMGDKDAASRHNLLQPYQINEALMAKAAKDAVFMHCLPAHRDEEMTTAVIDGPQSVVFDEAENRLHAQKAVLNWCLGKTRV